MIRISSLRLFLHLYYIIVIGGSIIKALGISEPSDVIVTAATPTVTIDNNSTNDNNRVLFFASKCYDVNGVARMRIQCPPQFVIESALAFSAISRHNVCSFSEWDCILQEGDVTRCDTKPICTFTARHNVTQLQAREDVLRCDEGARMFVQVEFLCVSGL